MRRATLLAAIALLSTCCGSPGPLTQIGSTTVEVPLAPPVPAAAGGTVDELTAWSSEHASAGASARAVQAYGAAEPALRRITPGCGISWTTLAGIATIESANGTVGGAVLNGEGVSTPRIRGPLLDGTHDNEAIPDTDEGRLDGLTTGERAVGPFQFLPATWQTWGTDGDGDGSADPDDIDDAAAAAGRYLCSAGGDLTTATGWTAAVFAYNHSDAYVRTVHDAAEQSAV